MMSTALLEQMYRSLVLHHIQKAREKLKVLISVRFGVSSDIFMRVLTLAGCNQARSLVLIRLYFEKPLSQSAVDTGNESARVMRVTIFG